MWVPERVWEQSLTGDLADAGVRYTLLDDFHFKNAGLTEEELSSIEKALERIPRLIKKYYDLLVEQDKVLQDLMRELESDEYKNALETVSRIQSGADALSGLDMDEFDIEEGKHAYIFRVPVMRDTLH